MNKLRAKASNMKNKKTRQLRAIIILLLCVTGSAIAMSVQLPQLNYVPYDYTGASQNVKDSNTPEDHKDHYTLTGETSGTNIGTYTVKAVLKNKADDNWNLGGGGNNTDADQTITWTIQPTQLQHTTMTLTGTSFVYDGTAKTPFSQITGFPHLSATDYTVIYTSNVNVGTVSVNVYGNQPNCVSGPSTETFAITQLDLTGKSILLNPGPYVYHGGEWRPFSSVTGYPNLKPSDYTISYSDNINAGTATVTVTGKGPNCTGSTGTTFKIDPAPLTGSMKLSKISAVYDGTPQQPTVTVGSLVLNQDFNVSYDTDFTSAGTKLVTASGMGNYSSASKLSANFIITPKPMQGNEVVIADIHPFTYTGLQLKP